MTSISVPAATRLDPVVAKRVLALICAAVAVILYVLFKGQWTLPHQEGAQLFLSINEVRDWIDANRTTLPLFVYVFGPIRAGIAALIEFFAAILATLGWPGVIAVAGVLGLTFGGWRIAALSALGFASLGVLGLWVESMATLSQVLAAVIISVLIGVPLGIIGGRSKRFSAFITPILDFMQIMPTFAYLAPVTLLFLIGAPAGTVATLIYAIPPAVRITALGIRGVPRETLEAATSLGSTRWQVLTKVQLPLARRTIGLGINQTIMMALSMIVITALIGAPGLGRSIMSALQSVNVGAAFQAGLAIVILAIVLDRLTEAASEASDPRTRQYAVSAKWRRPLAIASIGVVVLAILYSRTLAHPNEFPKSLQVSFVAPVNDVVDWITTNMYWLTIWLKDQFTIYVINPLEYVLTTSPFWLVIGVTVVSALFISSVRAAIAAGICLLLVAALQLWEHGMQTLTQVLIATAVTLAVGVVFGIQSARSDRTRTALRPFLDAAQTLPSFVYLIPAVALFSSSRFTAIVAAIIYAVPPVIRLVDSGIRGVSTTVVEAATAAGSTERQLLWKVRLPLSRNSMLLAVNQGIILVLAMVVVGALVGGGGLGFDVISGFVQHEDFGKGFAAGLAIVLLGIMLDRVTQGAGRIRRSQP